jgi:hypothetical protein
LFFKCSKTQINYFLKFWRFQIYVYFSPAKVIDLLVILWFFTKSKVLNIWETYAATWQLIYSNHKTYNNRLLVNRMADGHSYEPIIRSTVDKSIFRLCRSISFRSKNVDNFRPINCNCKKSDGCARYVRRYSPNNFSFVVFPLQPKSHD